MSPPNRDAILAGLTIAVPDPRCELDFATPFQLLIATELSAQCTDAQVNRVTPSLFARWPDAAALAQADVGEVEGVLHRLGFFRQKAKNAVGTARILVERHGGQVPPRMEDLLELPGVARKTANVVLGTAFGIPSGITVDTHVFRVTRRWGWHREKDPPKVERVLQAIVPQDTWPSFGHRVVLFGRYHCTARKPACEGCVLRADCPVGRGEAGA